MHQTELFKLKSLVLVLFIVCMTAGCDKEPILVGFSGPLTGMYSDLGVQGRNGAILAIEEINARGGVAQRELELIAKDDCCSGKKAREVDKELIEKNVVAIVGHMTSSQSVAALPVVQEKGVVMLSPTASTPRLSGKKDMFFRVQGSAEQSALALGNFAGARLNLKRVNIALDIENLEYTVPYKQQFVKGFKEQQGEVLQECRFSSNKLKNWQSVLDCLAKKDPKGILIVASARDSAALIQGIHQQNPDLELLLSGWAATNSLLAQGGQAVENSYLIRTGYPDKERKVFKDFVRGYLQRFGQEPSFAAVQGFQAVKILARALEKTKGKREGLADALQEVEIAESLNGLVKLDEYGDAVCPVTILKVLDGDFMALDNLYPGEG